jgi:hypothetical protein
LTKELQMLKTRILSPETYAQLLEKAKPRLCQHSSSFLAYCVLVFLGALSANFSFDEVFAWFKPAFSPLIDGVAAVYAEYMESVSSFKFLHGVNYCWQ